MVNRCFEKCRFIVELELPRSGSTVRKRPAPNNSGDFMEAVFRPKIFWIFYDDFRLVPVGKHRKLAGIDRKKSG